MTSVIWRLVLRSATATAIAIAAAAACVTAPRVARADGSLVPTCVAMGGAGHATCRRPSAFASASASAFASASANGLGDGVTDLGGAYSVYRLVSDTSGHRRCRLQPTCSLFAAQAARRLGILRGLLMGLARAQMSHSSQDGLLGQAVASDGELIFFDPVERWIHGAP